MKTFFAVCAALVVVLWAVARLWTPASKATALFCIDEIKDPAGLVARLRKAPDPLSRFLQQHLSDDTRALLQQWDGRSAPSFELLKHLAFDLNDILQGDPIYSAERFADVKLPPPTLRQAERGAVGVALIFLNRHLLEEAYPTFLAPMAAKPKLAVLSWTTDPAPARQTQLAPFHALHCDLAINVEPNTYDKNIIQCSSGVGADLIECYDNREMVAYVKRSDAFPLDLNFDSFWK